MPGILAVLCVYIETEVYKEVEVKRLFLSDLHLGSPLFKKEDEVISLVNAQEYDEIYILGDLFDTWEVFMCYITKKYKNLIKVLNDKGDKIVVIKCNHDPSLDKLKRILYNCTVIEGLYTTNFGDKSVVMAHGDEFDPDYWWTITFFPIHWFLQRLGFNIKAWIRSVVYKREAEKLGVSLDGIVVEAERKLVEKYGEYNILIFGHSHQSKIVKDGSFTAVNIGSVLHDPVVYEFESDEFIKREI